MEAALFLVDKISLFLMGSHIWCAEFLHSPYFLKMFRLFFPFVHKKYMNYKVENHTNRYRGGFPQPCSHKCDNSRKSCFRSCQRVAAQLHQFRVLECVFYSQLAVGKTLKRLCHKKGNGRPLGAVQV